jgi:hypothetical protein
VKNIMALLPIKMTIGTQKKSPAELVSVYDGTLKRNKIILVADAGNSGKVYVGNKDAQTFPLSSTFPIELVNCSLDEVFLKADSENQTAYVLAE